MDEGGGQEKPKGYQLETLSNRVLKCLTSGSKNQEKIQKILQKKKGLGD